MILLLPLQQYSGILVIEVISIPSLESLEFDRMISGRIARNIPEVRTVPNSTPIRLQGRTLGGNLIKKKHLFILKNLKLCERI